MALNFNSIVSDPKINLIGKEVPLEALEKTGNVLQGRYDESYQNETKTQALAKKLAASANPADKETAAKIMEHYGKKMSDRAGQGDYHNMRWQTQQDAIDVGGLYEGLATRNKELLKYGEDIDTKSGITDVNRRAYEKNKWLTSQAKTAFNSENGVLEGLNVAAPNLYKDVDMAGFTDKFGQGIIANIVGKTTEGEKVFQKGEKLPNGQTAPGITVYDVSTGRQRSAVTKARVREVVEGYAKASPEVSAYVEGVKDYYENSLGLSEQEAQIRAYNDVIEKAVQPAIAKYAHSSDIRSDKQGINVGATGYFGAGAGSGEPPFNMFGLSSIPNDIETDKVLSTIDQRTAKIASEAFNEDGSWKTHNANTSIFARNYTPEQLEEIRIQNPKAYAEHMNDPKNMQSFDDVVKPWEQDLFRSRNPKLTPKEMFMMKANEERDKAKILTTDFVIGNEVLRKNSDANFKALTSQSPFYKEGSKDKVTQAEIEEAWKSGGLSMNLYNGTIKIGTGDKKLVTVLGAINDKTEGNNNNFYQNRMKATSNVIKSIVSGDDAMTQEGLEVPKYINGKLVNVRYRMYKEGANGYTLDKSGRKVANPLKITGTITLPDGTSKAVDTYNDVNTFAIDMLTDVVAPSIDK